MAKVFCHYLQREDDALDSAPLKGEHGLLIMKCIGKTAWSIWLEEQKKVINEYKLDLSLKSDRERLKGSMLEFFELKQ